MIQGAVVLTFPEDVRGVLERLRERHNRYVNYSIEPHVTLKYPFAVSCEIGLIKDRLAPVARMTRSFTMVLNGVAFFQDRENVAYVAIEDPGPVVRLHTEVVRSLQGLTGDDEGHYEFEDFIPHATIAAAIPDEVFPAVKRSLSGLEVRHSVAVTSLSLITAGEDRVWTPTHVFGLSGR